MRGGRVVGRTESNIAASVIRASPRRCVRHAGWKCMFGMLHALGRARVREAARTRALGTVQRALHPRGATARACVGARCKWAAGWEPDRHNRPEARRSVPEANLFLTVRVPASETHVHPSGLAVRCLRRRFRSAQPKR